MADKHGGYQARFLAAQRKVGSTGKDRVAWLLGFADWPFRRKIPARPRNAEAKALQWECFVFAKAAGGDFHFGPGDPPPWPEVRRAQIRLNLVLGNLKAGQGADVAVDNWRGALSITEGVVTGRPMVWAPSFSFLDAFVLQVYESFILLGREGRRLRMCEGRRCHRAFIARARHERFCSRKCSQSYQTAKYRERNPERFRAARRAYYAKKMYPAKVTPQRSHVKKPA